MELQPQQFGSTHEQGKHVADWLSSEEGHQWQDYMHNFYSHGVYSPTLYTIKEAETPGLQEDIVDSSRAHTGTEYMFDTEHERELDRQWRSGKEKGWHEWAAKKEYDPSSQAIMRGAREPERRYGDEH